MFIEYKSGDLLEDGQADILVNAVNRRGFMGAGIALAFKRKYPEMFISYRDLCFQGAYNDNYLTFYNYPKDVNNGICIANLQTVDDNLKGQYNLVEAGLKQLKMAAEDSGTTCIAIPPLGCGIGGLDRKIIEQKIKDTFRNTNIRLHLYNF